MVKKETFPKKAVVLLSGGIDSGTTLAIAKSEGFEVYALTFDYRQRHRRELKSAKMVADAVGVSKYMVISFDMSEIGGSALISDIKVPKVTETMEIKDKRMEPLLKKNSSPIPITYVPARNTIFLSFALAWAEVLEAPYIFIGANAVDYSGYPDCRPEYLEAFEKMANLATKLSVENLLKFKIESPLLYSSKGDIIKKGVSLGLDYSLTWSCYDPQPKEIKKEEGGTEKILLVEELEFLPCHSCDSCLFRAKGFQEAGIDDPLLKNFR